MIQELKLLEFPLLEFTCFEQMPTAREGRNDDSDPIPSFQNPRGAETTLTFDTGDENGDQVAGTQLFVGHYQARALPVADTAAGTALRDSVDIVGGTYNFLVRANGFGHARVGTSRSQGRGPRR